MLNRKLHLDFRPERLTLERLQLRIVVGDDEPAVEPPALLQGQGGRPRRPEGEEVGAEDGLEHALQLGVPELLLLEGGVVEVVELGEEAVEVEDDHLPGQMEERLDLGELSR